MKKQKENFKEKGWRSVAVNSIKEIIEIKKAETCICRKSMIQIAVLPFTFPFERWLLPVGKGWEEKERKSGFLFKWVHLLK